MDAPLKPITWEEEKYTFELSQKKSKQYLHSRGYVREALSEVLRVPALDIPLYAPPGKPPKLAEGWGHVSFSHCCDALLIGWSPTAIGVDIERADRPFKADQLSQRYFSEQENKILSTLQGEKLRAAVLEQWVNKEAAIKWQRGKLSVDIRQWYFCKNSDLAIHKKCGYRVGFSSLYFNDWYMAVTFNKNIHNNHQLIICKESI